MKSVPHIVDCHCHIYPQKVAARAVDSISKFYDVPMCEDGTREGLLACHAAAGVTHAIIFSVATKPNQTAAINEFIAAEVKAAPDHFTGLGTLHAYSDTLESDFVHLMELGLRGVKLHPDTQLFAIDDPRAMPIYELCAQAGIPVYFHAGDRRYHYSNPENLLPVLEKYPNLSVIAGHMGGYSVWDEAARMLAGAPNLYVDCSSTMGFMDDGRILSLIRKWGADRVVFGSDFPMWTPKAELDRLLSLDLTQEEKETILYKNASCLFSLSLD